MDTESIRFETLRGDKAFTQVISRGRSVFVKPIRCFYTIDAEARACVSAGFAVVKSVRLSSERNLLKRRMREAYKLQENSLMRLAPSGRGRLKMVFMFAGAVMNIKRDIKTDMICRAMEAIVPDVVLKTMNEKS